MEKTALEIIKKALDLNKETSDLLEKIGDDAQNLVKEIKAIQITDACFKELEDIADIKAVDQFVVTNRSMLEDLTKVVEIYSDPGVMVSIFNERGDKDVVRNWLIRLDESGQMPGTLKAVEFGEMNPVTREGIRDFITQQLGDQETYLRELRKLDFIDCCANMLSTADLVKYENDEDKVKAVLYLKEKHMLEHVAEVVESEHLPKMIKFLRSKDLDDKIEDVIKSRGRKRDAIRKVVDDSPLFEEDFIGEIITKILDHDDDNGDVAKAFLIVTENFLLPTPKFLTTCSLEQIKTLNKCSDADRSGLELQLSAVDWAFRQALALDTNQNLSEKISKALGKVYDEFLAPEKSFDERLNGAMRSIKATLQPKRAQRFKNFVVAFVAFFLCMARPTHEEGVRTEIKTGIEEKAGDGRREVNLQRHPGVGFFEKDPRQAAQGVKDEQAGKDDDMEPSEDRSP